MGRKRIDESEKKVSLTVNMKRKVLDKIELDGKPKQIVEKMIDEKYGKD